MPEREENVGFTEEEEISWRQYFVDFRSTVWPMLQAEGFSYVEALMFWRQEIMASGIRSIQEALEDKEL